MDLLAHGAQLTAPFPYSRHRFPKFFVRDVQVALRLFDVGVAEHQLDRAGVHSIAQEPTGALPHLVVATIASGRPVHKFLCPARVDVRFLPGIATPDVERDESISSQ